MAKKCMKYGADQVTQTSIYATKRNLEVFLLQPPVCPPRGAMWLTFYVPPPGERDGNLSLTRVTQPAVDDVLHTWAVGVASPVGGKPCLQGLEGCKRTAAISIARARLDVKVTGGLQHSSCMPVEWLASPRRGRGDWYLTVV